MAIADSIYKLIGKTPLLKLGKIVEEDMADVYVKLEYFNPGGSVKDRIALNMIEDAEKKGVISPEKTVLVEPTSGNTGIGIAMVGVAKGYHVILVMPETMSIERRKLMALYGAEIVLTPGADGMRGAIQKATQLRDENENYHMLLQFENGANPEVHVKTTALEILSDMDSKVDAFVAGVGTGGTFTGVSTVLKERLKSVLCIAVEPEGSPVISGGAPGAHKIQGIGAGFVPAILNTTLIDGIEKISNEDAYNTMKEIGKKEGVLFGPSSGAAICAALRVAKRLGKGKTVVVVAPDNGERYLSMLD
ncbi:cysteine synthase A [bacterium]|nr:cysteine synthase A [bacterium]